ncbi:TPA: hypothetical protein RLT74_005444 [Klebsiella pneumoniae]|nr:hypothetical protein [Klebsiella pneumoniae]
MIDLLKLLYDNNLSLTCDLANWFEQFPSGAAWNIYSDYCVGNTEKANDSFSFVITLKHDTDQNFSDYIMKVAPKDLKKTRKASNGLISYLNCPMAFSVSFIVERESKLLRDFITDKNMKDFCVDLKQLITMWAAEPESDRQYWGRIDKALTDFNYDIQHKSFNSKLARQLLLTSTFAGFLFAKLNKLKSPSIIRWVSDRDATFDKYNGVAFDISFIFFLFLSSKYNGTRDSNKPKFLFAYPFIDGKTDYAAHIRLPDYLAGLCADINLPSMEFSHSKFDMIFESAILNSVNNIVLEVLGSPEKITTRRLSFIC